MKGLLGKKVGMTQIFTEHGEVIPVTVVEAGPVVVTQIKTAEKDGYTAIQVGFEDAKEKGYVETLFHRRRYIPELTSKNYMVRQFGTRVAMNTPIQGTAADIMKIAMIEIYNKLREEKLDAKIVLQVHDELIIECKIEEKEKVKEILQNGMENAAKLSIPLKAEVSEATNWYEAK